MLDIEREQLLTFKQAAKYLPEGRRPSLATWWRWYRRGVKGFRLETVVVGGRRYTTIGAIQRFAAALSTGERRVDDCNTAPLRASSIDRAERALRERGVLPGDAA